MIRGDKKGERIMKKVFVSATIVCLFLFAIVSFMHLPLLPIIIPGSHLDTLFLF